MKNYIFFLSLVLCLNNVSASAVAPPVAEERASSPRLSIFNGKNISAGIGSAGVIAALYASYKISVINREIAALKLVDADEAKMQEAEKRKVFWHRVLIASGLASVGGLAGYAGFSARDNGWAFPSFSPHAAIVDQTFPMELTGNRLVPHFSKILDLELGTLVSDKDGFRSVIQLINGASISLEAQFEAFIQNKYRGFFTKIRSVPRFVGDTYVISITGKFQKAPPNMKTVIRLRNTQGATSYLNLSGGLLDKGQAPEIGKEYLIAAVVCTKNGGKEVREILPSAWELE